MRMDDWKKHLINTSKESIFVNHIRYTLLLGHYPKGSEIEKYMKGRFVHQKGNNGLVWYGEVSNALVIGISAAHGISKSDVLNHLRKKIENKETWLDTQRKG